MAGHVIALVDDLIFASRIQVEAEQAGATCQRAGSLTTLRKALAEQPPGLVIVDLEGLGFDGVEAIRALRAEPAGRGLRVIAFGSHVEPEKLDAAREAGADDSMPRSAFVRRLPEEIARA